MLKRIGIPIGVLFLLSFGIWLASNTVNNSYASGIDRLACGWEVLYLPAGKATLFAPDFFAVASGGAKEEDEYHFEIIFRGRDYGGKDLRPGESYTYPSYEPLYFYFQRACVGRDGKFLGAIILLPPGQLP